MQLRKKMSNRIARGAGCRLEIHTALIKDQNILSNGSVRWTQAMNKVVISRWVLFLFGISFVHSDFREIV